MNDQPRLSVKEIAGRFNQKKTQQEFVPTTKPRQSVQSDLKPIYEQVQIKEIEKLKEDVKQGFKQTPKEVTIDSDEGELKIDCTQTYFQNRNQEQVLQLIQKYRFKARKLRFEKEEQSKSLKYQQYLCSILKSKLFEQEVFEKRQKHLEDRNQELEAQLIQKSGQHETTIQKISETSEIQKNTAIEQIRNFSQQVEDLKPQLDQKDKQISKLKQDLLLLSDQLKLKSEKANSLGQQSSDELSLLQKEKIRLMADLTQSQIDNGQLKKINSEQFSQIQQLTNKVTTISNTLKIEWDREKKQLLDFIKQLNQKIESLEQSKGNEHYPEQKQAEYSLKQQFRIEFKDLKSNQSKQHYQIGQLDSQEQVEETQVSTEQLQKLVAQIQDLEQINQAYRQQIELGSVIQNTNNEPIQIEEIKQENQILQQTITQNNNKFVTLQKQYVDLEQLNNQLKNQIYIEQSQAQQEIFIQQQNHQKQLIELETKIKQSYQTEIETLNQLISDLKDQGSEFSLTQNQQNHQLTLQLFMQQEANQQAIQQQEEMLQQFKVKELAFNEEKQQFSKNIKELTYLVSQLEERVVSKSSKYKKLKTLFKSQNQELANLTIQYNELKQLNEDKDQIITQFTQSTSKTKSLLEQQMEELKTQFQVKLDSYNQQQNNYNKQIEQLKQELLLKEQIIDNQLNQIHDLNLSSDQSLQQLLELQNSSKIQITQLLEQRYALDKQVESLKNNILTNEQNYKLLEKDSNRKITALEQLIEEKNKLFQDLQQYQAQKSASLKIVSKIVKITQEQAQEMKINLESTSQKVVVLLNDMKKLMRSENRQNNQFKNQLNEDFPVVVNEYLQILQTIDPTIQSISDLQSVLVEDNVIQNELNDQIKKLRDFMLKFHQSSVFPLDTIQKIQPRSIQQ